MLRFFGKYILFFVLLSAAAGCGGNRGYIKSTVPENSLQQICEQRNIPWYWDSLSQVFTFSSQEAPAKVMIGSKLVLIGTKQIVLSSAVERKSNTVVVPPDFMKRVFGQEPQKQDETKRPHLAGGKYRKIMVDAGHGGKDPGALGALGAVEKEIVFDVAQRLKNNLEAMGFDVLMTRDGDEFISLQERTEMATRLKADLFLSIHANAAKTRKTRGLEIYYPRKFDKDTDLSQLKSNERELFKDLDISGERKVPEKIISDMMSSHKMKESSEIAQKVITKTSKDISAINRGSRPSGFFVVKNTIIPAVLFEVGYLTNAAEAKLLKTGEYRQKIADAIAESVKEYNDES